MSRLRADDRAMALDYDIVVPTIGRPSLVRLLHSIAEDLQGPDPGPRPRSVIVVDDRPDVTTPLDIPDLDLRIDVVRCGGRGPAASRNRGWCHSQARWICFLDDDVEICPGWSRALADDLRAVDEHVAAVQGRVDVPMPSGRRPTDRERNVGGLATASWITADMAVRRRALAEVGGFDERFPRAYREDSDLALRLLDAGWRLARGTREIDHPVGPAPWTVSVSQQRGNADDALMTRIHGPGWRERAGSPRGTLRRHVAAAGTAAAAMGATAVGRRRLAQFLALTWVAQWLRFSYQRAAPGPRQAKELGAMAVTSAALPFAAVYWSVIGRIRARRLAPEGVDDRWGTRRPRAVFFDRDGTLVDDVPYNGDPGRVEPVPGAREALDRLREAGIRIGLVSNQSGVARGLLTADGVDAVNARIVELLGPFDTIQWCPHGPEDRCGCRKPATGMLEAAAREVGEPHTSCAFVGDIGTDVEAGLSSGMRSILVPTAVTEADEVADAPEVAGSLADAVDALLDAHRLPAGHQLRPRAKTVTVIEEWAG